MPTTRCSTGWCTATGRASAAGSAAPAARVTFYVEVADLGAALKKAEQLGGKTVMPPGQVPGGPEIAQFTDPDGNVIGLIKAGSM